MRRGCHSAAAEYWDQQYMAMLSPGQTDRRMRCESTCRFAQDGLVDRMTSHEATRTAYCVIPKASCTFWLSIFRFLHNDVANATYQSPLDMPRGQVHASQLTRMTFGSLKAGECVPEHLDSYLRFMFVRNPYSRLWSSYIDKHFLLDFFHTEGRLIVNFFHKGAGSIGKYGGSKWKSNCSAGNISFAEFLTYVAETSQGAPEILNEHWRPVEYLCNPCAFCPHLVGRMETFQEDSALVLGHMNLTWILDSRDSRQQKLHQMTTLIKDNFGYLRGEWDHDARGYSLCVNTTTLALRLWSAFQMYGYLPNDWNFPLRDFFVDPTEEHFTDIVTRAYARISKEDVMDLQSRQQRLSMENAYKTVPMDVLESISSTYLYEFLTFDYEARPYELFGKRYEEENHYAAKIR